MDEHLFRSSLVEDQEAQSIPQSQRLDPVMYTDKTIPEFDEQDYTSEWRDVFPTSVVRLGVRCDKHSMFNSYEYRCWLVNIMSCWQG